MRKRVLVYVTEHPEQTNAAKSKKDKSELAFAITEHSLANDQFLNVAGTFNDLV